MYCVIPIFKEPFLHPLHKDNGLSALWVQSESAEEPFFIIQKHPDSDDILQDYKWLDEELIQTPDKKNKKATIVIITHKTTEINARNCLSIFKKNKNILKFPTLIRLYN